MSLPLAGRRVVVTRPAAQSRELIDALAALGADVQALPLLTIVPVVGDPHVDEIIAAIARYDLVIVTSANGADCLVEALRRVRAPVDRIREVLAVGEATAAALRSGGLTVDLIAESASSDGILAMLANRGVTGAHVLLPRARLGRPELPAALRRRGAVVEDLALYDTVAMPVDADEVTLAAAADALIVTSPSGVDAWVAAAGPRAALPALVTIGPTTSSAARRQGLVIAAEAATQDTAGVLAAVGSRLGAGRSSDPETD